MSKYCSKCGKEIRDGIKFCPNCGAKIEDNIERKKTTDVNNGNKVVNIKPRRTELKVVGGIILGIILVVIGGIWGVKKFYTPAYEKPVKKLEKAFNNGSFSDMKDAISSGLYNEMFGEQELSEEDVKELGNSIKEIMRSEYGEDYNMKVTVVDKKKIDQDDLKVILRNDYFIPSSDVEAATAAYDLKVKMEIKYKSDSDTEYQKETEEDNLVVIQTKEDKEWKVTDLLSNMW